MDTLFLSMLLSLSLLGPAASRPSADPVKAICNGLNYPDLCVSAISSVRKDGHGPIDAHAALTYIMQAVVEESNALRKKVEALPEEAKNKGSTADEWARDNDPGFSPRPLVACLESLGVAVDEMGITLGKLGRNDNDVTVSLSQVNDNISVCMKEKTVVLEDAARLSRHMSNCFSLVKLT